MKYISSAFIHRSEPQRLGNRTSHQSNTIRNDEEAGAGTDFRATPLLTCVGTLGSLETGCFYFHVLQHNIVYKMELV